MLAVVTNNHHWQDQRGLVVKEEAKFVVVRISDKMNHKIVYDVKFPRQQVKFEKQVGEA
jgi:hypothetical protein